MEKKDKVRYAASVPRERQRARASSSMPTGRDGGWALALSDDNTSQMYYLERALHGSAFVYIRFILGYWPHQDILCRRNGVL